MTRTSAYWKDEFSLEGIRALCRPGTALLLKSIYPLAKIEGVYIHLSTCMSAIGINTELSVIAGLIFGGGWWSKTLIFFNDVLPSCMQGGWWDTVDDKRKFEIKVFIFLRGLSRNVQRRGRSIWKTTTNVWGT